MTDTISKILSAAILANRKQFGWSLDEVAVNAGMSKTHIWELEKGRAKNPTIATVERLAEAFKISPSKLIGWSDKIDLTTRERRMLQLMRGTQ